MRRRAAVSTNDSFIYFHLFLITEMADGKGETRRLAETTTYSKQSLANEKCKLVKQNTYITVWSLGWLTKHIPNLEYMAQAVFSFQARRPSDKMTSILFCTVGLMSWFNQFDMNFTRNKSSILMSLRWECQIQGTSHRIVNETGENLKRSRMLFNAVIFKIIICCISFLDIVSAIMHFAWNLADKKELLTFSWS